MKKSIFFIHKIHPFNLPIALVASFFGFVIYWKKERVKSNFLNRFTVLDSNDYFTRPRWLEIQQEAYYEFQKSDFNNFYLNYNLLNINVDFKIPLLQNFAIDFENVFLFSYLVKEWKNKNSTNKNIYYFKTQLDQLKQNVFAHILPNNIKILGLIWYLDRLWLWFKAFVIFFKKLLVIFYRTTGNTKHLKNITDVWSGFSYKEMPINEHSLDFAFLSRKKDLNYSSKALYLSSVTPTKDIQDNLKKDKIFWGLEHKIESILPFMGKCVILFESIFNFLKIFFIFKNRFFAPVLCNFAIRSIPIIVLHKHTNMKIFLSTVSNIWPESPYIAALNALSVRTILWFYASSEYDFFNNKVTFDNTILLGSILTSKELWIWNELHREIYSNRQIKNISSKIIYRKAGPTMYGNSSWLLKSPQQARTDVGSKYFNSISNVNKWIAIFDQPIISKKTRIDLGHEPNRYTQEMTDLFYSDFNEFLKKQKNIGIIFKPKRSLDDPIAEYGDSLIQLVSKNSDLFKEGRVTILDHLFDTYIAISCADLCLGFMYTSPVFAGLHGNRAGIFYDPLCTVKYTLPPELSKLTISGKDNLFKELESWLSDSDKYINRQKQLQNSWKWLDPQGDPTANFYSYLQDDSF